MNKEKLQFFFLNLSSISAGSMSPYWTTSPSISTTGIINPYFSVHSSLVSISFSRFQKRNLFAAFEALLWHLHRVGSVFLYKIRFPLPIIPYNQVFMFRSIITKNPPHSLTKGMWGKIEVRWYLYKPHKLIDVLELDKSSFLPPFKFF